MALTLAVLLVGVLDGDFLVHEVLAVHVGNGGIRVFERGEGDEAVALGKIGLVASDLDGGTKS